VRRIWRQLGSLRPNRPNGLRIMIDTVRDEIRAVRNKPHWKKTDELILLDFIGRGGRIRTADPLLPNLDICKQFV